MAIKRVINIDANLPIAEFDSLNKSISDTGDEVSDLTTDVKDLDTETSKVSKEAKEMNKNLADSGKAKKGLKAIGAGFKAIGVAIKAAGIGLVISLFVGLKEVVGQNQVVMDFFQSALTTFNIVVNELVDVFKDVFKSTSESTGGFDALGKVMKGLIILAITPFKVAFDAIRLVIANAQLAWEDSVFGGKDADKILELKANIEEIKTSLKETGEEAIQAGKDIAENTVEAVGEIGDVVTATINGIKEIDVTAAKATADRIQATKNAAKIAAVLNQGLLEDYDRQAELQRQIRDDVNESMDERIASNNELGRILAEQEVLMLANADLVIQAARDQLALNNNTENQVVLQTALNEKKAVEATITGFQSEQLVNKIALENEELELSKTITEATNARLIADAEFNAERIEGEKARIIALQEALTLEEEIETLRLENLIENLDEGTQAKIDAEQQLLDFQQEINHRRIELDDEYTESIVGNLEKQVDMKQVSVDSAGAAINALSAIVDEETALGKSLTLAKQAELAAQLGIDVASTISSANKAATGAALAGAESGADIAKGAAKTAGSAPFPANIPLLIGYGVTAAAIVTSVIAAVRRSKSVASSLGGASSGGGSGAVTAAPTFTGDTGASVGAPNIDAFGGTSQGEQSLIGAMDETNSIPTQTYVVSTQMTSRQQLDRHIEDTASL